MKNHKKFFILIVSIAFFFLIVRIPFTFASHPDYVLNITTSPASGFITASNMAPGDSVSSSMDVQNTGNLNFTYTVSSRLDSGSEKLFSKLLLTIQNQNQTIFQGLAKDLSNAQLGALLANDHSLLKFNVSLPASLGNDFQGLSSTLAFVFTAVSNFEPEFCDFDPPFSNSNYSFKLGAVTPFKFHCEDNKGNAINNAQNGIGLIIEGPGINGQNVKYDFSYGSGMLAYNGNHYQYNFDSDKYPLQPNQTYKASIYLDDQKIGEKVFQTGEKGNRSN